MSKINIALCQEVIPHYRVPVFNLLSAHRDIELSVFAGKTLGSLKGAEGSAHFTVVPSAISRFHIGKLEFQHQADQLAVLDPKRFHLVILPWNIHYLSLVPALLKAKIVKIPVVLWGHGYSKISGRIKDFWRNYVGRRADGVLLYSKTVADRLIQEEHFDSARVFVAQNALNQAAIQEARRSWLENKTGLEAFRQQYGLDKHKTILFVSRLEPDNKIELLIDGLGYIGNEFPEAKLVIIGGGPATEDLKAYATSRGLSNRVIFTGPIYDENELAPWMLSATVFCYPVNIGLSIIHAFGYGLPVVTSDDIGSHNPEIEALVPGANGLLYKDGEAEDMADQWLSIMKNESLQRRLSDSALKQVLEKYTIDNMVQGFLDLTQFVDGKKRYVREIPRG